MLNELNSMLAHCKEIQTLLQLDRQNFSKNAFATLNSSNEQKEALLTGLFNLINNIQAVLPPETSKDQINFFDQLEIQASHLETKQQSLVRDTLAQLKTEMTNCYQSLLTNSQIVFANLQELKELWDGLLSLKPKMDDVYNSKGVKK